MRGLRLGLGFSRSSALDAVVALVSTNGGAMYSAAESTFQDRSATPSTDAGNGDPVGTMLDLSGNGHEVIAPSDGARPTRTDSGGLSYLDFDGSTDELRQQATLSLGTGSFICAGIQKKVDTDDVTRVIGSASVGQMRVTSAGSFDCTVGNATVGNGRINHTIGNTADAQVLSWGRSSDENNAYLREDGTEVRTRNHLVTSHNQAWALGSNVGSQFTSYRLYALVFLNKYPTSGEIADVEAWVAERTGVTL